MTALVTLILVLCGSAGCETVRVPGEMQLLACMIAGQQIAAEMGGRLQSWRCEAAERA